MVKNTKKMTIDFRPSTILMLLGALTLFILVMLQHSTWFEKNLLEFYGQTWKITWIMSFILLIFISTLLFNLRLLKAIFGFIIILAAIGSAVGLCFLESSVSLHQNTPTTHNLKFVWHNNFIPALIADISSCVGAVLWISNF